MIIFLIFCEWMIMQICTWLIGDSFSCGYINWQELELLYEVITVILEYKAQDVAIVNVSPWFSQHKFTVTINLEVWNCLYATLHSYE